MRILISGASGLIGTHLIRRFTAEGHQAVRLVRRNVRDRNSEIRWDPAREIIDADALTRHKFDAVVNLSGRSIAGIWTPRHKRLLHSSRIETGCFLATTLGMMPTPPPVYISMSAVGFYGDRGDDPLTDASPGGTGFMAELCREWEGAADPAREAGIRVIHPRLGIVLAQDGGFLSPLLPLFTMGLGAEVGDGRQWVSWIHMEDVISALLHLATASGLSGPVALVSPEPVTMSTLTQALGKQLDRPVPFRIPRFLVNLLPGGMGKELLLGSQRVQPDTLLRSGFVFSYPRLEAALSNLFPNM